MARPDSRLSRVQRALDWIRAHYDESFRVDPLAAMTGMSVAVFYRHVRAITAMTPIQHQKRLRLLKAPRLMLFEPRDAAAIGFSVGYESASQLSREYARMFGMPPGSRRRRPMGERRRFFFQVQDWGKDFADLSATLGRKAPRAEIGSSSNSGRSASG